MLPGTRPPTEDILMAKVLVLLLLLLRSRRDFGAKGSPEGARSAGALVDIKRVPETVPVEVAKASYYKLDQAAPIATVNELAEYDAIIIGTPTRFGRISSPMASFSGSSRRPMDERRAQRQSRWRIYIDGHSARRPRNYPVLRYHEHAAFRAWSSSRLPYSHQGQNDTR